MPELEDDFKVPFFALRKELGISTPEANRIKHPRQDGPRCQYYYTREEAQQLREAVAQMRSLPAPAPVPGPEPEPGPLVFEPPSPSAHDSLQHFLDQNQNISSATPHLMPPQTNGDHHTNGSKPVFFAVGKDYVNVNEIATVSRLPSGVLKVVCSEKYFSKERRRFESVCKYPTKDQEEVILAWMRDNCMLGQ